VLTSRLLVAQYLVGLSSFMRATLAALVVGKAVLVANKMPWLRRYDRAPLIQPILFKTGFYRVVVLFARVLERFGRIKAMTERGSPQLPGGRAPPPTEREKSQIHVQRYIRYLPAAG
jgi:hypothetical protein